jgi:hypothetical protein
VSKSMAMHCDRVRQSALQSSTVVILAYATPLIEFCGVYAVNCGGHTVVPGVVGGLVVAEVAEVTEVDVLVGVLDGVDAIDVVDAEVDAVVEAVDVDGAVEADEEQLMLSIYCVTPTVLYVLFCHKSLVLT